MAGNDSGLYVAVLGLDGFCLLAANEDDHELSKIVEPTTGGFRNLDNYRLRPLLHCGVTC